MSERYAMAKEADGWAVVDTAAAAVVVIGDQVQRGLSGDAAERTADALNRAGGPDAMTDAQIRALLTSRPHPLFAGF